MKNILAAVIGLMLFSSGFISAQSLKIDNFSIKANGETEMISVAKDGKVSVNGSAVGVLRKDGKLKDLNGKTLAEMDKTGKVTANAKMLGIIKKNGEYDNGSGSKISWTKDGKFNLSESKFLTVAPNNKKFHQTATFLIFLYLFADQVKTASPTVSLEDEKLTEKFGYADADSVAGIQRTACLGDCPTYSIKIYGDGRITRAGESIYSKQIPLNKKEIQAKINRFLQKVEEIDFSRIYEKNRRNPAPFVHDGISISTGAWISGSYREVFCQSGSPCDQELGELHKYFVALFAAGMSAPN